VTSDHLALTSDGVKYSPVAVDEDHDWHGKVQCKVEKTIRLLFTHYNIR